MSDQPRMTDWRPLHDRADAAIVDEYRDTALGVGPYQRVLVRVARYDGASGPLSVALEFVREDTPAHPASSKVREIVQRTFPDIFR